MSSSKGVCLECDICYLQEIGHIQEACDPKCYEEQESQAEAEKPAAPTLQLALPIETRRL